MLCILLVHNLLVSLSYTQPTGITYLHDFIYPALMYAVMFYVILNKRKRLGDCVTFFGRAGTLEGEHYAALERVDVDTP